MNFRDGSAFLNFGGDLGTSLQVRVNGAWATEVAENAARVDADPADKIVARLRGPNYDDPYEDITCNEGEAPTPAPTTVPPATTTAPTTTAAPATTVAPTTTTAPTTVPPTTVPGPVDTGRFPTSPLTRVGVNNPGVLLGLSTGLTTAEREPRFNFIEEQTGRTLDIGHVFHSWDQAIPRSDDLIHLNEGRALMISWNGTDTSEIQNGVHDTWIRSQASAVRDLEQPVLLRWFWEMDGNRRLPTVHSGPDYVAAWNHIREIFRQEGATNAEFVWCPNAFLFWDGGDPTPWYPGDDNVDWLCADGYNWGNNTNSSDWMDFTEIFEDFHAWAAPRGLPIVIAETGSNVAEDDPNARAEWFQGIPASLQNDLPAIDAVVYFDKDFRFIGHPDWRLDREPAGFAAWNQIASHPYLNFIN